MPGDAELLIEAFDRLGGGGGELATFSPPGEPLLSISWYAPSRPCAPAQAITFGLSTTHPHCELRLAIKSADKQWGWALAQFALRARDGCPFEPGNSYRFPGGIAPGSEMTSLMIADPVMTVRLASFEVRVMDVSPLYEEEIAFKRELGGDSYLRHIQEHHADLDLTDPTRKNVGHRVRH